jgi:hypothetical protein
MKYLCALVKALNIAHTKTHHYGFFCIICVSHVRVAHTSEIKLLFHGGKRAIAEASCENHKQVAFYSHFIHTYITDCHYVMSLCLSHSRRGIEKKRVSLVAFHSQLTSAFSSVESKQYTLACDFIHIFFSF